MILPLRVIALPLLVETQSTLLSAIPSTIVSSPRSFAPWESFSRKSTLTRSVMTAFRNFEKHGDEWYVTTDIASNGIAALQLN
jgi:hypothetical protein